MPAVRGVRRWRLPRPRPRSTPRDEHRGTHAEHSAPGSRSPLARIAREPRSPALRDRSCDRGGRCRYVLRVGDDLLQSAPDTDSLAARHRLALPVASLTPGARGISAEELCQVQLVHGRSRPRCDQVVNAYGVERVPRIVRTRLPDHADSAARQTRGIYGRSATVTVWNARVKDELERLLPQLVYSRSSISPRRSATWRWTGLRPTRSTSTPTGHSRHVAIRHGR